MTGPDYGTFVYRDVTCAEAEGRCPSGHRGPCLWHGRTMVGYRTDAGSPRLWAVCPACSAPMRRVGYGWWRGVTLLALCVIAAMLAIAIVVTCTLHP